MNVIAITKHLRSKGWEVRKAFDTARTVKDLADAGMLPPGDVLISSTSGSVTIRELEIAGGVVRLTDNAGAVITLEEEA